MAKFFGTSVLNLLKTGVNRIFLPIVCFLCKTKLWPNVFNREHSFGEFHT